MATTRDYLEYLNQKIDIAPVNSEEEYQAAGLIESLMQSHGLETRLQDFEAPGLGTLPYRVCGILMFAGVFLSGFLTTPAAVIGELVVLASLVLLGLRYLGIADPIGRFGRPLNSQNVIGVHRATGPLVTKGSRPIVIVAHYDTPRENLLYAPPFDRWQRLLRRFSPQFTCVAALFAFVQTFPFVPSGVRHLIWVLGIVAALPQLLVGIAAIQERFAPCTEGSNDNKSGVAAMLGVMSMVHPGDDAATGFGAQREQRDRETAERLAREAEEAAALAAEQAAYEAQLAEEALGDDYADEPEGDAAAEPFEDDDLASDEIGDQAPVVPFAAVPVDDAVYDDQIDAEGFVEETIPEDAIPAAPEPQVVVRREVQVERVEGVRHGREVIESLGILPADCEIVYVEPQTQVRTYEELVEGATVTGVRPSDFSDDHSDYYDEADDGYWNAPAEEPGPSVLDRVRDFLSGVRQTVGDRIADFRERRAASGNIDVIAEDEYPDEAEEEIIDAVVSEEPAEAVEPAQWAEADEALETVEDGVSEEDVLLGEVYAVDDGEAPEREQIPTGTLTLVPDAADVASEPVDEPIPSRDAALEGTLQFVPLGELVDGNEVDDQPKDVAGLDTLADDGAVNESLGADEPLEPAPIDDPEWGKSSFQPEVTPVARRAVLFDLPDPLGNTGAADPLSGSLDATDGAGPAAASADTPAEVATQGDRIPEPIETIAPASAPAQERRGGLRGLFGRRRKDEEQESMGSWLGVGDDFDAKTTGSEIGSWDNFTTSDAGDTSGEGSWKGGATRRSDLRVVEDDDVRVQEDLREAILGMGDDELIAHDIWYVALGGSHADQAGMRAFLDDNRRSVRGCFLVNLDCVGDGELSLFTTEGLAGTRKADRRIVRLLTQIADDLHIDLLREKHDWEETDATPAMRTSLRCVTIAGVTPDGALALSKVADDEPDLVDPAQTTAVADLVAELIRRS